MLSVFDWVLNVMNEAVCKSLNEWMNGLLNCQLYFYVINVTSECDLFQETTSIGMNGMNDCVIGVNY